MKLTTTTTMTWRMNMRNANTKITAAISAAILSFAICGSTHADPLPGEVLKFQQKPLANVPVGAALYQGSDLPSTAYPFVNPQGIPGYQGFFAADDFADKLSTPVVHLRWWGNYLSNPN